MKHYVAKTSGQVIVYGDSAAGRVKQIHIRGSKGIVRPTGAVGRILIREDSKRFAFSDVTQALVDMDNRVKAERQAERR